MSHLADGGCAVLGDQRAQAAGVDGLAESVPVESELRDGPGIDNFDPLMGAHNAIVANAMETAARTGGNPMAMMSEDPEHPEWACPLCYLNWLSDYHDRECTMVDCARERGFHFEWMIERAADDMLTIWREMAL